jgi:hypothetical protein
MVEGLNRISNIMVKVRRYDLRMGITRSRQVGSDSGRIQ